MKEFFLGLSSLAAPHLFLITIVVLIILYIIYYHGIHFKVAGTEIDIGGHRKRADNKDYDDGIRLMLYKHMNEVDKLLYADIGTIIEDLDNELVKIFEGKCPFTVFRFNAVVKQEFYKRVNSNDLKIKLSLNQRETYVKGIKNAIKDKYLYFQNLTEETSCEDLYPTWNEISDKINTVVDICIDKIVNCQIYRLKEKIDEYNKVADSFKIKKFKEKYCTDKIKEHTVTIKNLGGKFLEHKA